MIRCLHVRRNCYWSKGLTNYWHNLSNTNNDRVRCSYFRNRYGAMGLILTYDLLVAKLEPLRFNVFAEAMFPDSKTLPYE